MNELRRAFYSIAQKTYEHYYNTYESNCIVYMFHQVNDDKREWDDPRYSITGASFIRMTRMIGNYVAIDSILNVAPNTAYHVITFDDAYDDAFQYAVPILERNGIPYTFFVASELIGTKKYLTRTHLNILAKSNLCTIGSHTSNHKMLSSIPCDEANKEIVNSKDALESMIGKEIKYFAYPYGSLFACSRRNIEQVKATGYSAAFSTMQCKINVKTLCNRWFLPRVNVNESNYLKLIGESNGRD